MTEQDSIDLYADPRVKTALARLQGLVSEASISQTVRASLLYVAEGAPDHEIKVYLEEQINLERE